MELPNIKVLSNGLRVINVPFEGIDSVTVTVEGLAGSNHENPDEVGVAHLLEHTVFGGTKKYPTNSTLEAVIENVGGYNNASTSRETVEYYVKVLKEDIEVGFDFLSQIIIDPLITAETIKKEREIVRQEAIRSIDDPKDKFLTDRYKTFFPNQRVAYPVIGELTEIRKIKTPTVANFHATHYNVQNFVIGVCGNIPDAQVYDLAEKYFSAMPIGTKNPRLTWKKDDSKSYFVRKDKDLNQVMLKITYFAPPFAHEDMYAARFLSSMLGGNFLSRLFQRLRIESGYAYSVGCPYNTTYDFGMFTISISLAEKNLAKAVEIINEEIKKASTELFTEEEFERERKQNLAGYVFHFEKPANRLSHYTSLTVKDWYPKLNHEIILENYQKVTREDVLRVAQQIFSGNQKIGVLSKTLTTAQVKNVL